MAAHGPGAAVSELVRALDERVKELSLIHRGASLLESAGRVDARLLDELVQLIPKAWQFPELCEARIVWGDLAAQTPRWQRTEWVQNATFVAARIEGSVAVAYREAPPSREPFMEEETALLASFSRMVAASLGRLDAERVLNERGRRLEFLAELAEATLDVEDADDILGIVVRMLGSHLRVSRCLIGHIANDGLRCNIAAEYRSGVPSFGPVYDLTPYASARFRAEEMPVVVRDFDIETPPEIAARNRAHETRATVVCSHVRDGRLRSLLALQQSEPRDWTDDEVMLARETVMRTWATIARRAAENRLRRNEALLRIAGAVARVGGFSIDVTDRRVTWSDEVCAIHERPAGTTPSFEELVAFHSSEDREVVASALACCMREGMPFDLEVSVISGLGRKVWVRMIGRAERNAAGEIVCVEGALQDIGNRRELEERLRHAQKMEAVGRLAAGVAHDFNNILAVIINCAQFAMDELPGSSAAHSDVAEIAKAAERAASLTRQLLAFSRQQVLKPARIELATVVRGVEKMLAHAAGFGVRVIVSTDEQPSWVFVDTGQIEQLLMNLVVNARDAMDGTGTVSITVATKLSEGHVTLAVTDNGTGMDDATRERIFEPFFTTKEVGRGTGLGLATVHGIVTQSGGRIEVESSVGVGTTFRVHLPAHAGDERHEREAPPSPSAATTAAVPRGGDETILVVECVEQLRAVLCTTLRRAGYDVIESATAGDALLAAEQHPKRIDLLVASAAMPRLSGTELAARITKARADMRTIIVSKPFAAEMLLERVRATLDEAGDAKRDTPTKPVIVIDDEPALLALMTRRLEGLGYATAPFSDPTLALRVFTENPDGYGALVSDVNMRQLNGFEVAREARRMRPGLPVVMVSGHFRAEDVRAADALSINALVEKTATIAELESVLKRELAGSVLRAPDE